MLHRYTTNPTAGPQALGGVSHRTCCATTFGGNTHIHDQRSTHTLSLLRARAISQQWNSGAVNEPGSWLDHQTHNIPHSSHPLRESSSHERTTSKSTADPNPSHRVLGIHPPSSQQHLPCNHTPKSTHSPRYMLVARSGLGPRN
ncbi:hypothetical protein DM02DRAFT_7442 [Periconia macrospinosa]|uniref:Uncharacterized protein n=1 Tax=Periconia macrospinosa TaxID=97972 RepID=A0A2V1EEX4_9PLEO|nr:hypothetical protein DM02DRAFT_7442 [Periconia macrospinosa]